MLFGSTQISRIFNKNNNLYNSFRKTIILNWVKKRREEKSNQLKPIFRISAYSSKHNCKIQLYIQNGEIYPLLKF